MFKRVPANLLTYVSLAAAVSCGADDAIDFSDPTNVEAAPGLQFHSIPACRITVFIGAGASATFTTRSSCGLPITAKAISTAVTAKPLPLPSSKLAFLSIWPTGVSRPVVSTLNSFAGGETSNSAIVPIGSDGNVNVFVTDPARVDLDITGYFADPAPGLLQFYPLAPCRVHDTRETSAGPIAAGTFRPLQVAGKCGVPTTAEAYALNVTAVPAGPLARMVAYPSENRADQPVPISYTVTMPRGNLPTAASTIVAAGPARTTNVWTSDRSDVILDVTGYFAPPSATGLDFYPQTPCRVVDTREPWGPLGLPIMGAGTTRSFPLTSSPCGVVNSNAYSLNLTVVPEQPFAFLSMWPTGVQRPVVSTLNAYDGTVTANGAIVPTLNGSIDVFVTGRTHVVLDINGRFGLPPSRTLPEPEPEPQYDLRKCVDGTSTTVSAIEVLNNRSVRVCLVPIGVTPISSPLRPAPDTIIRGFGPTSVLRRVTDQAQVIFVPGSSNVKIENLTIDGNRFGFNLGNGAGCYPANYSQDDLVIWHNATNVEVANVKFYNALDASIDSYGDFAKIHHNEFFTNRSTGIHVHGNGSTVENNRFEEMGTAAVTVHGTNVTVRGNQMLGGRHESPDGIPGGQLNLEPSSVGAIVEGNTIDGRNYSIPRDAMINIHDRLNNMTRQCAAILAPGGWWPIGHDGIEGYGQNHIVRNNTIINNSNNGMIIKGTRMWVIANNLIDHNGSGVTTLHYDEPQPDNTTIRISNVNLVIRDTSITNSQGIFVDLPPNPFRVPGRGLELHSMTIDDNAPRANEARCTNVTLRGSPIDVEFDGQTFIDQRYRDSCVAN